MNKQWIEKTFGSSWYKPLKNYLESEDFIKLAKIITKLRKTKEIFPRRELLFNAFKSISFNDIKVVIYGQAPYFKKEEENDGLAFSNSLFNDISPALFNILQEINNEYPEWIDRLDYERLDRQDLNRWVKQGVMLFNISLTVQKGIPASHLKYWKNLTIATIQALNTKNEIIHVFFGKEAKKFSTFVTNKTHAVIKCIHPGAETFTKNTGFLGSNVFKEINNELLARNKQIIQW